MAFVDVLIIGSGLAGLTTAIKLAQTFPSRRICVLTKDEAEESNTLYAQGGIAVVTDFLSDSFERHIQDTCQAGDGLCDPFVVTKVISEAPARIHELVAAGIEFDRNENGELMLAKEGGHHANRIVHWRDATGLKLSTALLEKAKSLPNVTILSHRPALDLLIGGTSTQAQENRKSCQGVLAFNPKTNEVEKYVAHVTVLATGGLGQLYNVTTNPRIATGDGIAMAHRAGACITNMEFIQFHPTALVAETTSPSFLISEAVRGHGAYIRNQSGERFLFRYHSDGELACRDVVARAIATEIADANCKFVYLDCRHIARDFPIYFPTIYNKCLSIGIHVKNDFIPVAPAAHYLCGGINVNVHGETSIQNLYACGECANTGLHGANRLASNSLLEALVYAHACYFDIAKKLVRETTNDQEPKHLPYSTAAPCIPISEMKKLLQHLMTKHAGIVRDRDGLSHVLNEINGMETRLNLYDNPYYHSPAWCEIRNMIDCSKLIIAQSLTRQENKGVFYSRDL